MTTGTHKPTVTETQGRSYVTKATLLLVSGPSATAELVQGRAELVIPGLMPIYRTSTLEVIGYGSVLTTKPSVLVRLFLDYSTPERLELETGAKKYLRLVLERSPTWLGTEFEQYLELSDQKPDDERVLPVGDAELALYEPQS